MRAEWFAGRLVELREAAGLTRKQLADRAGLQSEGGIRDIEQGRRLPNWEMVIALSLALGVTPDAFTVQPAERSAPGRGRPRKEEEEPAAPKRPVGRPRKQPAEVDSQEGGKPKDRRKR
jgi:transcriptional regulator with XRE-family HTH domain